MEDVESSSNTSTEPTATASSSRACPENIDLFMRMISLPRLACDQLSRDLMEHILAEFHSTDWNSFIHNPEYGDWFRKCFKRHSTNFSDTTPSLEDCDTTLLFDIYDKQATLYPPDVGVGRYEKYDDEMKIIKDFRNESAHFTNVNLTEQEYENKISHFLSTIRSKLDKHVFKSLDDCIQLVERYRREKFEDFCRGNPKEVKFLLSNLSEHQREIAKLFDCLTNTVDDLVSRVGDVEARVEVLEKTENALKLPKSNLIPIRELVGREEDLNKISDCFRNSQIVSICVTRCRKNIVISHLCKFTSETERRGTNRTRLQAIYPSLC